MRTTVGTSRPLWGATGVPINRQMWPRSQPNQERRTTAITPAKAKIWPAAGLTAKRARTFGFRRCQPASPSSRRKVGSVARVLSRPSAGGAGGSSIRGRLPALGMARTAGRAAEIAVGGIDGEIEPVEALGQQPDTGQADEVAEPAMAGQLAPQPREGGGPAIDAAGGVDHMHAPARPVAVDAPAPQRPGRARHVAPGDQPGATGAGGLVGGDARPADGAIAVVEHRQHGAAIAGIAAGDGGQVATGGEQRATPALAPDIVPGHVGFSFIVG